MPGLSESDDSDSEEEVSSSPRAIYGFGPKPDFLVAEEKVTAEARTKLEERKGELTKERQGEGSRDQVAQGGGDKEVGGKGRGKRGKGKSEVENLNASVAPPDSIRGHTSLTSEPPKR